MRPLVTYPDIERETRDFLADVFGGGFSEAFTEAFDVSTVTVGIGLPQMWTKASLPHVQVALDGTPIDRHPVEQRSTLRVTVWASSPTGAKALAQLAHGYLLASQPYLRGTGLFVTHDPDHDAELASFTVRASVRSVPIPEEGEQP